MIKKNEWEDIKHFGKVLVYYDEPQVIATTDNKIIALLVEDDKFIVSVNEDDSDITAFINRDKDLRSLFLLKKGRTVYLISNGKLGCFGRYSCIKINEKNIKEDYLPKSDFYL
jgi:hypothetical protein